MSDLRERVAKLIDKVHDYDQTGGTEDHRFEELEDDLRGLLALLPSEAGLREAAIRKVNTALAKYAECGVQTSEWATMCDEIEQALAARPAEAKGEQQDEAIIDEVLHGHPEELREQDFRTPAPDALRECMGQRGTRPSDYSDDTPAASKEGAGQYKCTACGKRFSNIPPVHFDNAGFVCGGPFFEAKP